MRMSQERRVDLHPRHVERHPLYVQFLLDTAIRLLAHNRLLALVCQQNLRLLALPNGSSVALKNGQSFHWFTCKAKNGTESN